MSIETITNKPELEPVPQPGWLLVLTGPSGVGKDSVRDKLLEDPEIEATNIVTHAARPKRPGEIDGVHYNFETKEDFEAKIQAGFFAEWIPSRSGYKGTPKAPFTQVLEGKNTIWRVDISRASTVDAFYDETFDPEIAQILKDRTLVVCVGVGALQTLMYRAKGRAGENWPDERDGFRDQLRVDWRDWQNSLNKDDSFDRILLNDGAIEDTAQILKQAIFSQFGQPEY